MTSTPLISISPLDGRYHHVTHELGVHVSEYALIKTRTEIEITYLLALSKAKIIRPITIREKRFLLGYLQAYNLEEAQKVKSYEQTTRHDVKAVEKNLREILKGTTLQDLIEMVHFGLTSEDVNNLSYRLMLQRATSQVMIPYLNKLRQWLRALALEYKSIPMLARTHGQPAVPTTLGKEIAVFASRLNDQLMQLESVRLTGKFAGAVGNFNAVALSHPQVDWITFSADYVRSLGLRPNQITTQINSYDDVCEYLQIYQRINSILIGLDQDIWRYISDGWFIQEVKKGEVGSSTMPQKVNPIDFENSEGNLGMANAVAEFFCRKLMISRLQRDLSDSTTIRNIGTVLGYCLVGYKSILSGSTRIRPNTEKIKKDLHEEWSILTEGVQTLLRKEGIDDPYSLVSSLSKGKHVGDKQWRLWVSKLKISAATKKRLFTLNPDTYIGLAEQLTEKALKKIPKR